jgi:hypothetical protein
MTALCRRFAKLLTFELESLEEELEMLLTTLDERLQRHEITDYVRNENYVVLRNEILGLRDYLHSGCTVDSDEISTPDEAAAAAKDVIRHRLTERGYVPALYGLVALRVDKVANYLKMDFPALTSDATKPGTDSRVP